MRKTALTVVSSQSAPGPKRKLRALSGPPAGDHGAAWVLVEPSNRRNPAAQTRNDTSALAEPVGV
jgi:hypothetical protein